MTENIYNVHNFILQILTFIFVVYTAFQIWKQVKEANESKRLDAMLKVHEKISSSTAREDRRFLYKYYEENQSIIPDKLDDEGKQIIERICVNFDVVGSLIKRKLLPVADFLESHYDVIIKTWKCAKSYINKRRSISATCHYVPMFEYLNDKACDYSIIEKNDFKVELGLGLIGIGRKWGYKNSSIPNKKDVFNFLEYAIFKKGIYFLDTAPAYGISELLLGKFLKKLPISNRKSLFIATKFGEFWDSKSGSTIDHSYDRLLKSFENSLSVLGKIDLIQIHKATNDVLNSEAIQRIIEYISREYKCLIGASVKDIESAKIACLNKLISYIQFPFNLNNIDLIELIDFAYFSGKKIIINRPFDNGKLLYSNSNGKKTDDKIFDAFDFIISKNFNGIILTGTKSKDHLHTNIKVFNKVVKKRYLNAKSYFKRL